MTTQLLLNSVVEFLNLSFHVLNAFLCFENFLLQVRIASHVLKVPALLMLLFQFFLLANELLQLLLMLLKENLLLLGGGRHVLCDPPAQFCRIYVMNGASVVGKLVKLDESHIAYVTFVAFSGVTTNVRLEVVALGE